MIHKLGLDELEQKYRCSTACECECGCDHCEQGRDIPPPPQEYLVINALIREIRDLWFQCERYAATVAKNNQELRLLRNDINRGTSAKDSIIESLQEQVERLSHELESWKLGPRG